MKTIISKENKAKYIVQYYGQKVMYVGGVGLVEVGNGGWNIKHPDLFLELTSLSSIRNEDIILLLKKALFDVWGHYSEFKDIQYYEENGDMGVIAFTEDNERIGFTINHHNGTQFRLSIDSVKDVYVNHKAMYDMIIQLGYAMDYTVIENGETITYSDDELVEMGVIKLNY